MYGVRTLKISKSLDGGKTFTPAVSVVNKTDPELAKAFQTFDISNDGKIFVGSLNYDIKTLKNGTIVDTSKENGFQASIIASADGGQTFGPSKTIEKFTCECCNVNVLTAPGNDVYVSWRQKFPIPSSTDPNTDNVIGDIVVAHSEDGGKTFDHIHKVANDSFAYNGCVHVGAPMAIDSKGNLHIIWYIGAKDHPGIYYAVSADKGKTFTKPFAILTGKWVPPLRSDISIDNKNNAWITWDGSYGLTANNIHWKFENTSAKIYVERINGNDNNSTITKITSGKFWRKWTCSNNSDRQRISCCSMEW